MQDDLLLLLLTAKVEDNNNNTMKNDGHMFDSSPHFEFTLGGGEAMAMQE